MLSIIIKVAALAGLFTRANVFFFHAVLVVFVVEARRAVIVAAFSPLLPIVLGDWDWRGFGMKQLNFGVEWRKFG